MSDSIPFIDLGAQYRRLGSAVDEAIGRVLQHGRYILGPEVAELEAALEERTGVPTITCASGTDALLLSLMALNVGPGDAVLVPSFTFAATVEMVVLLGATAVFCDIERDTFNLDPASIRPGVAAARAAGVHPVGLIAVDLFGQPADYGPITEACSAEGLWVIDDAAQSLGANYQGAPVGSLAPLTTTSFFPAKPLGAYGDGGAVFVKDPAIHEVLLSLRVHGQGIDKYENTRVGVNGRLDTLQAAVLLQKLAIFDEELVARDLVARRYQAALSDVVHCPEIRDDRTSSWAQFTVRVEHRELVIERLAAAGIPTAIYYPRPLHVQPPYRLGIVASGSLPETVQAASVVLSLPFHPYLSEDQQEYICASVRTALQ